MTTHDESGAKLSLGITSSSVHLCSAQSSPAAVQAPLNKRVTAQPGQQDHISASSEAGMYVENDALAMAAHARTATMPLEVAKGISTTYLSRASPSPHKPSFKIHLPAAVGLPSSLSMDTAYDRALPPISLPVLTPPEEIAQPAWQIPDRTQHGRDSHLQFTPPLNPESKEPNIPALEASMTTGDSVLSVEPIENFLATSVQLAVEKFTAATPCLRTIRTVHHTAPCPIIDDDNEQPVSILRSMLAQLAPPDSTNSNWVLVTHAVPEKYPVKEVTAPAVSPSVAAHRDSQDYFGFQKVVSNAVVLSDRTEALQSPVAAPISPGLASTPYSIDLSLYQRVIPPATAKEVRDCFTPGMPSALVDRLTELVPGGRLLFVYPTQNGAATFQRDYVEKVLAPITRSIVFGKGLPSEACAAIASSGAAEAVPTFDSMREKLEKLLEATGSGDGTQRLSRWSLLSSGTHQMVLPSKIWQQWWVLQETVRIRSVMDYYFRQVSRRSFYRDEHFTANELARQVMDQLVHTQTMVSPPPIEIGMFVIERCA